MRTVMRCAHEVGFGPTCGWWRPRRRGVGPTARSRIKSVPSTIIAPASTIQIMELKPVLASVALLTMLLPATALYIVVFPPGRTDLAQSWAALKGPPHLIPQICLCITNGHNQV
jgi:hypothetical protein